MIAGALGLCQASHGGEISTTFTGPNGGNWSAGGNWSGGSPPANDANNGYAVYIPDGKGVVQFDVGGATTINSLNLGSISTAVAFTAGGQLTVSGDFNPSGGLIRVNSGSFTSPSIKTPSGSAARLEVSGGSVAQLGITAYVTGYGYDGSLMLLSADGAGSQIGLGGVNRIDASGMYGNYNRWDYSVQATGGGVVDLSAMTTVVGARNDAPGQWYSDDWLRFGVSGNSQVKLDALAQTTGRVKFDLGAGVTQALPALKTMSGAAAFVLDTSATLSAPQLISVESATFNLAANATISAPQLLTIHGAAFNLGVNSSFNSPLLQSVDGASFALDNGSAFRAPALTSVTNSNVAISPGRTWQTATLTNVNHSVFTVSGGSVLDLSGVSSYVTGYQNDGHRTLLWADGPGSQLKLGALQRFDASGMFGNYGQWDYSVQATGGGVVDLSAMTTVAGARNDAPGQWYSDDWLRFGVSGNSQLKLDALAQTTGRVKFDLGVNTSMTLPALKTMTGAAAFMIGVGATLDAPQLLSADNPTFDLAADSRFNAPLLRTLNGASITLGNGSTFNAPSLTGLTDTSITMSSGRTWTTGTLTNVNHSRIAVGAGISLDLPGINSYTTGYQYDGHRTILSADGPGARLNLGSLSRIDASGMYGNYNQWDYSVQATGGGVVDLSAMTTVAGARNDAPGQWYSDDWLRFGVSGNSQLKLDALAQISGRVKFDLGVNTSVTLPALKTMTGAAKFVLDAGATLGAPQLLSAESATFDLGISASVNLPQLSSVKGAAFNLGANATFNGPLLRTLDGASFALDNGSSFHAPALTSLTNSEIALSPGRTWETATLTNVNQSRLSVAGGSVLDLSGISSYATGYQYDGHRTLLAAAGPGSQLKLGGLQAIDASGMFGNYGQWDYSVQASGGGVVDLSGLTSVAGARNDAPGQWYSDDWLRFGVSGSGQLKLDALAQVSGRTRFDVSAPLFSLPSLLTASSTRFTLGPGTKVSAPALLELRGAYTALELGTAATFDAPQLISISDANISMQIGSRLNTPALAALVNSNLSIGRGQTLTLGSLKRVINTPLAVDRASVDLSGVEQFSASYADYRGHLTLLSADGPGALIDLSKLVTFDGSSYGYGGAWTYNVVASNDAVIDLSGVRTIKGARVDAGDNDDRLVFTAQSGGTIKFGTATRLTGRTRFELSGGSTLDIADMASAEYADFVLNDISSTLSVRGNLYLNGNSSIRGALLSRVSVGGSFVYATQAEALVELSTSVVQMNGSGLQWLEVGGTDGGLLGASTGNFGFGRLEIGEDGKPTTVQLLDIVNNGNRVGGKPEALYLFGLGGADGLLIHPGSSLILDDFEVYAWMGGHWVNVDQPYLDSLRPMPLPQITVFIPEPGAVIMLGAAGCWVAGRRGRRRRA